MVLIVPKLEDYNPILYLCLSESESCGKGAEWLGELSLTRLSVL